MAKWLVAKHKQSDDWSMHAIDWADKPEDTICSKTYYWTVIETDKSTDVTDIFEQGVAKIVDQIMLTRTFTINELEEKIKEMKRNNFISLTLSPNEPYKVDQLLKNLVLDNLLDELKR